MPVSPSSLILVAVMKSPRDLEIARLLGWYRIPLRTAPKVIAVDYLAFYQTGAFEGEKWMIKTIAPVRGHELCTRAELLRDEPGHPRSHEEYYKIQLGPLEPLARPVPAGKWRRITFFYTTGEYLLEAETVNDLIVRSDERQFLWQSLRERASQVQAYHAANPLPEADLDPSLLALLIGIADADAQGFVENGKGGPGRVGPAKR
jgi:hypothetical protein